MDHEIVFAWTRFQFQIIKIIFRGWMEFKFNSQRSNEYCQWNCYQSLAIAPKITWIMGKSSIAIQSFTKNCKILLGRQRSPQGSRRSSCRTSKFIFSGFFHSNLTSTLPPLWPHSTQFNGQTLTQFWSKFLARMGTSTTPWQSPNLFEGSRSLGWSKKIWNLGNYNGRTS